MKLKIYKKHWDSSQKFRYNKEFDALTHCLVATAFKEQYPELGLKQVGYYHIKPGNGDKSLIPLMNETDKFHDLIHSWVYSKPEGRASLPMTFELIERGY